MDGVEPAGGLGYPPNAAGHSLRQPSHYGIEPWGATGYAGHQIAFEVIVEALVVSTWSGTRFMLDL